MWLCSSVYGPGWPSTTPILGEAFENLELEHLLHRQDDIPVIYRLD